MPVEGERIPCCVEIRVEFQGFAEELFRLRGIVLVRIGDPALIPPVRIGRVDPGHRFKVRGGFGDAVEIDQDDELGSPRIIENGE